MKAIIKGVHTVFTVFTWLDAVAFITLVYKIDAATIQTQPPLNTR